MTTQQTPLKPCPFCGGVALPNSDLGMWYVKCIQDGCGCVQEIYATKERAIEVWNTRVSGELEAVTAERDALLSAIEPLLEDERNDLRQTVSQMNEALEAVTAERDALLAAIQPLLEGFVDSYDFATIGLARDEWQQLREAVRKAGGE